MTLYERLKQLEPDTMISIACTKGYNYIYIGTVGEFLENKEKISEFYYKRKIEFVVNLEEKIRAERNKLKDKSKTKSEIASIRKALNNHVDIWDLAVNRRDNFIPVHECEVVEEYERLTETHNALLIEAHNTGLFWSSSETYKFW